MMERHFKDRKTRQLVFSLVLVGLLSGKSLAQQASWQVQPTVCIVEKLGDQCEIELTVTLQNLTQGRYCYYQDERRLFCQELVNQQDTIRLSFVEATTLHLKDERDNTVLSHSIGVKAREGQKRIRRVRQPWSLF